VTCEAFSQKTGAVRNERSAFYEGFSLRSVRTGYAAQLRDYLMATGAEQGILVFLSLSQIVWVEKPVAPPTRGSEPSSAS
jgi:hypothetical protein